MSEPTLELADTADLTAWETGDPALLLGAAESAVRDYCGWHIAPQRTEVVTVDGSGGRLQPLPTLHLVDVLTVTEDGTDVDVTPGMWSAVGYLWRWQPWTGTRRGIVAEITHGYTEVPLVVTGVMVSAVARWRANPTAARSRRVGQVSATYGAPSLGSDDLLPLEKSALDRYRIPT